MPIKFFNIVNNFNLLVPRRCSANPVGKGNDKAAMPALIRPNLQQPRLHNTVKSNPIKSIDIMIQLASHRCHDGNLVILTFTKRQYASS